MKPNRDDATVHCCADCGEEGGVVNNLKTCKSCMSVKYCNVACQRNHWATHKKDCKQRAAELRDEALFKDPPAKEDCPICFLPMNIQLICCVSLPPATITSVPINDFAILNVELADEPMEEYYPCCGKSVCKGCMYSFCESENDDKCPFCNSDRGSKTDEERVGEVMKRVEANDARAIYMLANSYQHGFNGSQQDHAKAMELYARSAELGHDEAHCQRGKLFYYKGDLKKAKFHYEAAAMAGHEIARCDLGIMESNSGNTERAIKHWSIAASAGEYQAMHTLIKEFEGGFVSRDAIDAILIAYNNACAEMRSEARDAYMRLYIDRIDKN